MATTLAKIPLRVMAFPGGANLPLWIAEEKGFYADCRLAVRLAPAANSAMLVKSLLSGEQDIALCAFDHVVAYVEGQGEMTLPMPAKLFAFMGYSRGTLRFVVGPEVKRYADLRGKTLAVDAKSTGYSLALRKVLQLAGLRESEYAFASAGGTATRAQLLMEKKFAGTMLTTPLEIAPESQGCRRLANVQDVLGSYQTIVGVAHRSCAAAHRDRLVRFIRASVAGLDWLFDDAHRAEAVAIYRKFLPSVPREAAEQHVDRLIGSREGLVRDGSLDKGGIATVLAIRSEFGRPQRKLEDPSRYIDESYYEAALRSM